MSKKPEQDLTGSSVPSGEAEGHARLHLDPPMASSDSILIRGRILVPRPPVPRLWILSRRKPQADSHLIGVTLHVRLPDGDLPREVPIGPLGEFEAHFAANLPRLRDAQRWVQLTLQCHQQRLDKSAPLFMPRSGATLGVLVLAAKAKHITRSLVRATAPEPRGSELSQASREIAVLLSSAGLGGGPNPVFYVGLPESEQSSGVFYSQTGWPEGLAITTAGKAAHREAVCDQAAWLSRLMEFYANELEFVIIADTTRHTEAVLQAIPRLNVCTDRLRCIFLNDTRPVARGVRRQHATPPGIRGLELPIALCRTLDEARQAVERSSLLHTPPSGSAATVHTVRRISAGQARVTRHPLVFCHGMLGYSVLRLENVDLDDYFVGLRKYLIDRGFHLLMPQIGRTHGIQPRADQLRQAVGRWTSGPVNIIAHSMGGLDARHLISKLDMADRVVSLTTIGTPHHGTYFADWFVDRFDSRMPFLRSLERIGLEVEGFRNVTRAACRNFNAVTPDSPKVRYLSYSAFQVARKIPPVLRRSHSLIARVEGSNDGLVSEASARWGEHLATLRADHFSLVGERGPEYFDHLALYCRIVEDLVRMGF